MMHLLHINQQLGHQTCPSAYDFLFFNLNLSPQSAFAFVIYLLWFMTKKNIDFKDNRL